MPLVTTIIGDLKFIYSKGAGGTNVLYEPSLSLNDALATGTILDTADRLWVSQATALTGSGTNNHDFAGSLADAFGDTLTFVKIKMLYIYNLSPTAGNNIVVGNGANPLLIFGTGAHTHTIGPNGKLLIWEPSLAGKAVTADTGDNLLITNSTANAVTYDIAVVGTSA